MTVLPPNQISRSPLGQASAALPDFLIAGPQHRLATRGKLRPLPAGGLDDLAQRAADFFAAQHPEGPQILVGAVPHARNAPDMLVQPEMVLSTDFAAPAPHASRRQSQVRAQVNAMRLQPEPSAASYRAAVAEALDRIDRDLFRKIVLSRSLKLTASQPHDCARLLSALRADPLVTLFSTPLPTITGPRHLIGATPELLIEKRGALVCSHPLAGSTRRCSDRAQDQAAAQALLASDKDQREHAMAAEMVMDSLSPYCRKLSAPHGTTLTATARMWHLGTGIEGILKSADTPCAELLALLHPTPAVCGLPRAAAEAALPELEAYDRGFYAGAIGWLTGDGDGVWYLALRCAEISGTEARLYAGAGIVAGSDPAAEAAETSAKFLAMLTAFGIDEAGNPL